MDIYWLESGLNSKIPNGLNQINGNVAVSNAYTNCKMVRSGNSNVSEISNARHHYSLQWLTQSYTLFAWNYEAFLFFLCRLTFMGWHYLRREAFRKLSPWIFPTANHESSQSTWSLSVITLNFLLYKTFAGMLLFSE